MDPRSLASMKLKRRSISRSSAARVICALTSRTAFSIAARPDAVSPLSWGPANAAGAAARRAAQRMRNLMDCSFRTDESYYRAFVLGAQSAVIIYLGPQLPQISFDSVAECPHTRTSAGLLHTPPRRSGPIYDNPTFEEVVPAADNIDSYRGVKYNGDRHVRSALSSNAASRCALTYSRPPRPDPTSSTIDASAKISRSG